MKEKQSPSSTNKRVLNIFNISFIITTYSSGNGKMDSIPSSSGRTNISSKEPPPSVDTCNRSRSRSTSSTSRSTDNLDWATCLVKKALRPASRISAPPYSFNQQPREIYIKWKVFLFGHIPNILIEYFFFFFVVVRWGRSCTKTNNPKCKRRRKRESTSCWKGYTDKDWSTPPYRNLGTGQYEGYQKETIGKTDNNYIHKPAYRLQ